MPELLQLMRDGGYAPSGPVDLDRIRRGVSRRRRNRGGLTIAGVAGAVAVTIGTLSLTLPGEADRTQPAAPAPAVVDQSSQSEADAVRDGVPPAVAALPFELRIKVQEPLSAGGVVRIPAPEGVWVVSRIPDPMVGSPEQLYGYGEVVLLDATEQVILRAFPLLDVPPTTIAPAEDAVYCARQGDGGLPTSMLCRIDRASGAMTVRVYPSELDDDFAARHPSLPDGWSVGPPAGEPVFLTLSAIGSADSGIVTTTGDDYPAEATFDTLTLELLSLTVVPAPESNDARVVSDAEQTVADAFVAFAQDPSAATAAAVPFGDEVSLGLGSRLLVTHPGSDVADPSLWVLPLNMFRARTGDDSALARVASNPVVVGAGPRTSCASDAVAAVPGELEGLRTISIQPADGTTESCLDWFAVRVFVDGAGRIAGVTLDLWEP